MFLHCSLTESNALLLISSQCQGTLVSSCLGDVHLTTLPYQFGGRCKHLLHLPNCPDTCTIPKNLCTSVTFDSSCWRVSPVLCYSEV